MIFYVTPLVLYLRTLNNYYNHCNPTCELHGNERYFFSAITVINAENAAHKSEKFSAMATRTRHEYLKDLATNYVTNTTLETGAKGKGN